MPPAVLDPLLSWLAVAGGMATSIGAVVALWRWLRPLVRGLGDFLADWRGEPARPGLPRRPGVLERLASLESAMDAHIAAHGTAGRPVDLHRRGRR